MEDLLRPTGSNLVGTSRQQFFDQEAVLANEMLPSVGYSPEDTKAEVTEIQP